MKKITEKQMWDKIDNFNTDVSPMLHRNSDNSLMVSTIGYKHMDHYAILEILAQAGYISTKDGEFDRMSARTFSIVKKR